MANQIASFNVPTEYDMQRSKIDRAQRMAEMLMQQSQAPAEQFSYGGYTAPTSPITGVSKIIQGLMSQYQMGQADDKLEKLGVETRKEAGPLMERLVDPNLPAIAAENVSVPVTEGERADRLEGIAGGSEASPFAENATFEVPGGVGFGGSAALPARAKTPPERYADIMAAGQSPITSPFAMMEYKSMSDQAKALADYKMKMQFEPAIAGAIEAAKNPALINRAEAISSAQLPFQQNLAEFNANLDVLKARPIAQAKQDAELPGQQFERANKLRDEFNALTKDFRVVQDAYNKIISTSDTGPGDMSMLYSYIKLLDPGSVVRESEFGMAAAAGSFGERIQGLAQRVVSGERMAPSLRESFKTEADKIYQGQKVGYDQTNKNYRVLARKYQLDPADVIQNSATPRPAGQDTPPVSALKEGVYTTFPNAGGQVWTLRNGSPVQVK